MNTLKSIFIFFLYIYIERDVSKNCSMRFFIVYLSFLFHASLQQSTESVENQLCWVLISNKNIKILNCNFLFSLYFLLYPACSRIGRGSLVLMHSTSHFPTNFKCTACWQWRYSTPRFASTPKQRNKNKNIKYFIFLRGNRTHSHPLVAFTVARLLVSQYINYIIIPGYFAEVYHQCSIYLLDWCWACL